MDRGRTRLGISITMMIFLTIISSQSVVSEDNDSNAYPIIIDHSLQRGMLLEGTISFPVYIENEIEPVLVQWELHSGVDSMLFQDVSDSILLFDGNRNRPVWTFEISIEAETVSPCSCILSIKAQESGSEPIYHYQSIFITYTIEDDASSEILPPTVYFPDNIHDNWASGIQYFDGISSTYDGSPPEISYTLKQSSEIRCDNYEDPPADQDMERNYPNVVWEAEEFSIPIDVSELPDGWVDVVVSSRDPFSTFESHYCFPIRVDNTPPTSHIEGPNRTIESITSITYSASNISDQYWGIGGIVYVWSVYEVLTNYNRYILVESGTDVRSITIDINESNTYLISLKSIDKAGNSNTDNLTLDVENLPPIARLLINGDPVYDGNEISISREMAIDIDASLSSDTQNDQNSLRCVWRINNIPVYEGENRALSWPADVEGEFLLSLEVIDDDSASSIISIKVVDNQSDVTPPLALIGFFLSCLFLIYAASRRSIENKNLSDIPKWD